MQKYQITQMKTHTLITFMKKRVLIAQQIKTGGDNYGFFPKLVDLIQQNFSSKHLESTPAIHNTLDHFNLINSPFSQSITVGIYNRIFHCKDISMDTLYEAE